MKYIKVWCEYDFGGQFGSDNNEDAFIVSDDMGPSDIDALVLSKLAETSGTPEKDLDALYGWEFIEMYDLKGV